MRIASLFVVLCIAATTALHGQNFGEINGTVTDASGAIVAGAAVTITNTTTNVPRRILTNESGNYVAPFLTPPSPGRRP